MLSLQPFCIQVQTHAAVIAVLVKPRLILTKICLWLRIHHTTLHIACVLYTGYADIIMSFHQQPFEFRLQNLSNVPNFPSAFGCEDAEPGSTSRAISLIENRGNSICFKSFYLFSVVWALFRGPDFFQEKRWHIWFCKTLFNHSISIFSCLLKGRTVWV